MDGGDKLSNVLELYSHSEGGTDKVKQEELTSSDQQCQPVLDSDDNESKDEDTITAGEGLPLGYGEEHAEMVVSAVESKTDEAVEGGFPMADLEIHREMEASYEEAVADEGVMEPTEMLMETHMWEAHTETEVGENLEINTESEMEENLEMNIQSEVGETELAEAEMETVLVEEETEMEVAEEEEMGNRKRKRGRNSRVPVARMGQRKKDGEDVCFICFNGGELVVCDRRGCSKAYHPSCVNREEAFFRAKGRWNCGVDYVLSREKLRLHLQCTLLEFANRATSSLV